MAACRQTKITGRVAVLEYAIGCGDKLPKSSEWKRLGAMRTKDLTLEWDTVDGTADDSIGSLRENLANFQNMSVSGDGTLKVAGAGSANLIEMTKHVANPVATGGQPSAWLRLTYPDLTFTAFMIVTNMSRSAPYDDVVTYSLEASATASDFGLIVEDTPDPDAPEVTSVNVLPETLSLEVGEIYDIEVIVLPTGASQKVVWTTSDSELVAVHPATGVVTAINAGTATVTATSDSNSSKSDSCEVTVT